MNYRDHSPQTVRLAHLLVRILKHAPGPVAAADLRTALGTGHRETRRACKYARDHGAPVMCTRSASATFYWLEHITAHTEGMPNRYLDDAYQALIAWYRASQRGGGPSHMTLRRTVGTVIRLIGNYARKDDEQITEEMRRLPDPVIDAILAE